jgi:hypothetical protein
MATRQGQPGCRAAQRLDAGDDVGGGRGEDRYRHGERRGVAGGGVGERVGDGVPPAGCGRGLIGPPLGG